MFKSIATFTAVAFIATVSCTAAHAALDTNGLDWNGVKNNGIRWSGASQDFEPQTPGSQLLMIELPRE